MGRHDGARQGDDWHGLAGEGRYGHAWHGVNRSGEARLVIKGR